MKKLANFVNGDFQVPIDGKYFPNYDPSNGEVFCEIPASNEKDVAMVAKFRMAFMYISYSLKHAVVIGCHIVTRQLIHI